MQRISPILYLAPMIGISDASFRVAFVRHFGGVDRAISPFLRTVQGGACKESKLEDLNPNRQAPIELYPQILSNQVDDFVTVAEKLFDMGYLKINLNLGCPVPMAAGRGRGAGLLPHPDYVDRMLDGIMRKIPNQLSIKTRLGYMSEDEIEAMYPVFNRYPLFAIAIHPRTARQGYGGTINLERFATALVHLKCPVIYSGDITNLEEYQTLRTRFPMIGQWMLGRGLLRDPTLAQSIQEYETGAMQQLKQLTWARLTDFYEDLAEELRSRKWESNTIALRLKTQFYYRAESVDLDKKCVKAIRKCHRLDDFFGILRQLD